MSKRYNIPDKIHMANVYRDGNKLVGLADEITLPDFESMTETMSGFGMLGEIESPTPGFFSAMELEIPFRTLADDMFDMYNPNVSVSLTIRAAQQVNDDSGNVNYEGLRVVVRGRPKGLTGGSVKQGSPTGSSIKLELSYIYIEYNSEPIIELDKFNSVFKVRGEDVLKKARSLA